MNAARGSAVSAVLLLLAACAATPTPRLTSTPILIPSQPAATTLAPTDTAQPPASQLLVPGFEDWTALNGAAVEIERDGDALVLTLVRRALWFQAQRGVLFWVPITGDFVISARVHTVRASDPSQPPGGDGTVQLAGLMARADAVRENYVFIVVGSDPDGLSVETKSTTQNATVFDGPAWGSASAELQLCRSGSTFVLTKRDIGSDGDVIVAATYERPDLPATLQVGVNVYSDSAPDVVARFESLGIEPQSGGCITG